MARAIMKIGTTLQLRSQSGRKAIRQLIKNREVLSFREADSSDEAFLREMLYHSLYVPDGEQPFERSIVDQPEIAKYVVSWGRPGDLGVIALDAPKEQEVGAAWMRLFSSTDPGFGFVDSDIPELAIAVLPGHRGSGVGSALLQQLFKRASSSYDAVSLSVSLANPALRLYERSGFQHVEVHGDSLTMLKRFQ